MNSFLKLVVGAQLILTILGTPWYSGEEPLSHYSLPLAWGDNSENSEYSNEVQGQGHDSQGYSDEVPLADDDDWQQKAVSYINSLRAQYSYPPLKLDPTLTKGSQRWAEKIAKTCKFDHADQSQLQKDGDPYASENLAQPYLSDCSGSAYECAKAGTKQWYDEKSTYDCTTSVTINDIQDEESKGYNYYEKVGHYMNMMDKSKTTVGYGYAKGRGEGCKESAYIVARYSGQDDSIMAPELKKVGDDFNQVDLTKFVPCPQ